MIDRRRHRYGAALAVVFAAGAFALAGIISRADQPTRATTAGAGDEQPVDHGAVRESKGGPGPAPEQPMLTEPLSPVAEHVLDRGPTGDVVAFVNDAGEVCLSLTGEGGGGGLCADPTIVEPIILGEGGDSPNDPQMTLFGVSQGRIEQFRFTPTNGEPQVVAALHHPLIPELSFFVTPAMGPIESLEAVGDGISIAASERSLMFSR